MPETLSKSETLKVDRILDDTSLTFEHLRQDVHVARMRIAGCGWVDTDEGVVLADTLYSKEAAQKTLDKIHQIGGKIEYIAVKLPEHLQNNPYLQSQYSRPEFFVFNTYRWYHGYFDHNPAHLLPRPEREVNEEIFNLIGDAQVILDRARELLAQDQAQLGLEVLNVLIQADLENVEARKLRIEILKELGSQDYCLMSRNAWVYFINKDREFLRPKGEL